MIFERLEYQIQERQRVKPAQHQDDKDRLKNQSDIISLIKSLYPKKLKLLKEQQIMS
jgi:hypothetical protein